MGRGLGPQQTKILDSLCKEPRGFGVLQLARVYFGNEDLTFPVRDIPGISAFYRSMASLEKRGRVKRLYGLWMATPTPVKFACAWCKEEPALSQGGLCANCIERAKAACPDCGEEFLKWPRQRLFCRPCAKIRTRADKRKYQKNYRAARKLRKTQERDRFGDLSETEQRRHAHFRSG